MNRNQIAVLETNKLRSILFSVVDEQLKELEKGIVKLINENTFSKEAVKSVIPQLPPINNNTVNSENDSEPENDLISPKEVCQIIKVSHSTLWRYNTITGILKPKIKIGRKVYYSKKEVSNFLNNNEI